MPNGNRRSALDKPCACYPRQHMTLPQNPPLATFGPVQISSISTAITATQANPIQWVYVSAAGSGGLVVKDQTVTSRTYSGLSVGKIIWGPFTELTSMTLAGLWYGSGVPPQDIAVASALAATTSALGGVKMSVAPASADSPIAVGTNDMRVTTKSVPMFVVQADGSLAESTVWIPGVACTITGATLSAPAAITQSDTNYLTFTLSQRDGAGGSASTIASRSTATTGGFAFLAFQALTLGSLTNTSVAAGSQVTFKSVKTSGGQAIAGLLHLNVTYTVP